MELLDWLKYILAAVLIRAFSGSICDSEKCCGWKSMLPTLHDNDQLLVDKVSKYFGGIDYANSLRLVKTDS
jgi:hypothetical protein